MKQLDADFFTHRDKRDTFDVKSSFLKLLYTIQNQKGLIIFISFSVLCVTVLYMQIWPPVFKAEVILRFEADNDPQRSDFYQQWNVFRRDSLTDEALLITSPPVLIKVIKRLELSYEDVYHPFASYVTHLWGQSSIGKSYRKFKNMILGNPNSIQALTQNERERMKVLKDFKASVSLSPISESNIGLLVVRGPSAYVATIANTVVDVYLEMRRTRFVQEAEEAYNALASEASRAYDELHNVETRMTNYFEKNGLIMAYEKDRTALQQWLQLQQSIIDLESIVASHRESLAVVEQQLTQEQRSITSARLYQKNTLENQLTQLLLQHRDALEHFQANSPEIQFINNQISSVRKLMKDQGSVIQESSTEVINSTFETLRTRRAQIESDLEGALAALNVKHAAEQTMRKNLETLPQKMYIENSLEREKKLLEKKYSTLTQKMMQAAVSRATARSAPPSMTVVYSATPPDKPAWPNSKLMFAVALFVGLTLGILVAILIELLFARVNRYQLTSAEDPWLNPYAILISSEYLMQTIFKPHNKST